MVRKLKMATRQTHMRKVFVNADGTTTKSADKGWVKLRFELFNAAKDDKDQFVICDTFEVEKDKLIPAMVDAAAGYGLSQKLGDSVAGIVKYAAREDVGFTPDKVTGYASLIKTMLAEGWEDILNGFWTEEREGEGGGGSSITILLAAIVRAFAAQNVTLTAGQMEGIKGKLATKEGREAFSARKDVKVHIAAIKAERAAEAAKKAAAAADEADDSADDLADLI
jgi:hypothetical protein